MQDLGQTKSKPNRFCSDACRGKHRSISRCGPLDHCPECGALFRAQPNMQVCSWACRLRKQATASVATKSLAMLDNIVPDLDCTRDDDEQEDGVSIPLRSKDGSIRAYVVVDAVDADWANQWRWYLNNDYASRTPLKSENQGRMVRLHRALMGLKYGDIEQVDHEDLNKLNCRRKNMRVVPKGKNQQNQGGHNKTSKYRGVHWSTAANKWCVTFRMNGETKYFGIYADELEAAKVAKKVRLQSMPYSYPITKGMAEDELLRPA